MRLPSTLRTFYVAWRKDEITTSAAALAYYAMFSLPPLLLLIISAGGFIAGDETARMEVMSMVNRYVTGAAGDVLLQAVESVATQERTAAMTIIGVIGLLAGGTGVIRGAQRGLVKICGTDVSGRRNMLIGLARVVLAVPILTVLLIAALAATALLSIAREQIAAYIDITPEMLGVANNLLSLGTLTVLMFALYVLLSPCHFPAGAAFTGAFVAAVLMVASKSLIGFYAATANLGAAYGVAASLLVLLLSAYISAIIFLTGAEIAASMSGIKASKR